MATKSSDLCAEDLRRRGLMEVKGEDLSMSNSYSDGSGDDRMLDWTEESSEADEDSSKEASATSQSKSTACTVPRRKWENASEVVDASSSLLVVEAHATSPTLLDLAAPLRLLLPRRRR